MNRFFTCQQSWKVLLALGSLLVMGCKHPPDFQVAPIPIEKPSSIVYTPNSIQVEEGTTATSSVPVIVGENIVYRSVRSTPVVSATGFTIQADGAIKVAASVPAGTYVLDVILTNAGGTSNFPQVFTVTVVNTTDPVSNLSYSVNTLETELGTADSSVAPSYSGSTASSFEIQTSPSESEITINTQGKIMVSEAVPLGEYTISVTAINAAGSREFPSVYTVKVVDIPPSGLSYNPNSLSLSQGSGGVSAIPSVNGTNLSFSIANNPDPGIIINPINGQLTVSTSVPSGYYVVDILVSNSNSSQTFTSIISFQIN
ncbi:MAG: hypothetical protein MUF42_07010 [Cytophagaceae bacterium]|jgi:hypothetical protein|nr:hypothetical protein [Cytophagaceae bacterium]